MGKFKKYAAPLGVFALLTAGAAGFTFVKQTDAKGISTNIKIGMGQMKGQGVGGTVTQVSGNTITLTGKNGTTYTIDATGATITKVTAESKTTINVSQIAPGDTLMVMGTVSGNNVTAKTIIDGAFPSRQAPAATGTVASISGNTISLISGSTTYTVDATNAELMVVKPAGTSVLNSGILVGDNLTVFGSLNGNNIVATRIMDGKPFIEKPFGMRK